MRQIKEITHNGKPLAVILDAHGKWLRDEEGGIRAYLSGANLSGANLHRANLHRANLNGANLSRADGILRVGPASDGYEFFAVVRDGAVWIKAGCHWFTAADARAHWQKTRAGTAQGAERIAFVDFIDATFKARGDL